jgi:hypothetical protein
MLDFIEKLVKSRKPTKEVFSGNSEVDRGDQQGVRSGTPRPAPWELSFLGHHLRLNLRLKKTVASAKLVMKDCKEFLLADYTYVPSWDPSKASGVGLW